MVLKNKGNNLDVIYTLDDADLGLKVFRHEITRTIESLEDVLQSNLDDLDGAKIYEKLEKAFEIHIEDDDYLEMFSKKNGREYIACTDIATSAAFKVIFEPKVDWMLSFRALVAEGVELENRPYSLAELEEMVSKKDIVLLHNIPEEISDDSTENITYFTREQYQRLHCYELYEEWPLNRERFIDANPELFKGAFKKSITRSKLIGCAKDVLEELEEEVKDVLEADPIDENDSEVIRVCSEWYNEFSQGNEFVQLTKALTNEK